MKYNNFWETSDNPQDDLKYTDSIHEIIEEQRDYLFEYTKGKVFAVFDEIKLESSMVEVAKTISTVLKGVSGFAGLQESVAESSTRELIDANTMYFDKRYGFEICTEKYRFRIFEMRMTPIYPVEITIDEGICKNVGNKIIRIAKTTEKSNKFIINDEGTFCNVLQIVLQDKKVRYLIKELQKRVQSNNEETVYLPEKVIICEGQTDEVILNAIAKKLNQKATIVVADGKYRVPAIFDAVKGKNEKTKILIVIDSDGEEEATRKMIVEKIGSDNYELAINNGCIEDWFMPEVADFSKLKLMQSIDTIIENMNWKELRDAQDSFAKVVDFLQG